MHRDQIVELQLMLGLMVHRNSLLHAVLDSKCSYFSMEISTTKIYMNSIESANFLAKHPKITHTYRMKLE